MSAREKDWKFIYFKSKKLTRQLNVSILSNLTKSTKCETRTVRDCLVIYLPGEPRKALPPSVYVTRGKKKKEKVRARHSRRIEIASRELLFCSFPAHYAAGLSWRIQVACEENPSRLEKLTARREGSKPRWENQTPPTSSSEIILSPFSQALDRLRGRAKKRRRSNERFIISPDSDRHHRISSNIKNIADARLASGLMMLNARIAFGSAIVEKGKKNKKKIKKKKLLLRNIAVKAGNKTVKFIRSPPATFLK
ncbi:hypothetical protein PUN28_008855 [Cardiocondyla obscurior]|uniref:Uncharacterized protein n=1 Tax=Cardiocondyla obscurior TaxID=286306 RepID=A0AAW2FRB2_9HYME